MLFPLPPFRMMLPAIPIAAGSPFIDYDSNFSWIDDIPPGGAVIMTPRLGRACYGNRPCRGPYFQLASLIGRDDLTGQYWREPFVADGIRNGRGFRSYHARAVVPGRVGIPREDRREQKQSDYQSLFHVVHLPSKILNFAALIGASSCSDPAHGLDSPTVMNDFNIVVLISGRGSNLKALIEQAKYYRVSAVVSNNPEAGGLAYAAQAGIPTYSFSRSDYPSLKAFKQTIFEKTAALKPDAVALAGFMQVIQPEFVRSFYGRMLNIHPSLLPAYPGLDTHARVIAAGERLHGCTVHFVDAGVDTGPIIAQAACELTAEDTEHSAADKVLCWEHKLYPWAANCLARGEVRLGGGKVERTARALEEAVQLGFLIPA